MNIEKHKEIIEDFLKKTLGRFGLLQYSFEMCTEEADYTAWLVDISNTTNKQRIAAVLAVSEDEQSVQLEVGEDLQDVTYAEFLGYLFMWNFCTWPDETEGIDVICEKARKWDELDKKIGSFYVDDEGNELPEDQGGDLGDIGEAAASAFGYL
jgi:hypothetical protein